MTFGNQAPSFWISSWSVCQFVRRWNFLDGRRLSFDSFLVEERKDGLNKLRAVDEG